MLLFMFAVIVVLLNILIAQLSDTYQNVQGDAQRELEISRAWIVARTEHNSIIFTVNSMSCVTLIDYTVCAEHFWMDVYLMQCV